MKKQEPDQSIATSAPPPHQPIGDAGALDDVQKYLSILFEPADLVEIRILPQRRQIFKNVREIPDLKNELSFANSEGKQDIYVGVNPRIREGGTADDVALARCLFADFDENENPENALRRVGAAKLPPPSLVVFSGHGTHVYWRLTEPLTDLAVWTAAQKKIISLVYSDKAIHDAPRVMRIPGFFNIPDEKKGEEEMVLCRVVSLSSETRYSLAELVGEITPPAARAPALPRVPSNPMDMMSRLSRATMQFIINGAGAGERNSRLFAAACDMAGVGVSQADTESRLLPAAESSGLSREESLATISSAFAQPRSPSVPDDDDTIGSALQRTSKIRGELVSFENVADAHVADVKGGRVVFTNVTDSEIDGEPVRYYRPLPQILADIQEAKGGWPRRAGGILFTINLSEDPLPSMHCVRWIKKQEELFAWLGHDCDTRWYTGECKHQAKKSTRLNPPTKLELFAYVKDGAVKNYRAVEILPHVPPILDLFYLPCVLPPVPLPGERPTPLMELVRRFNPDTEMDRKLMLAAMLTPGWGGPAGTRPAFVLTSAHGRGVGKTASANIMADVWGGAMSIGAKEDWDQIRKRFLGDDALTKRIALIDNIKGRLSGGDIEGFITAKEIDGWKPYVGQASRPNLLTWYMTANSPSLSRDLADRSVVIKIGKHAHGDDFIRWASNFVRENRPLIIAELLEILGGDPSCSISDANRDRWGAWQDAVLTRFEEGDEMAEMIRGRRVDVDSDQDDSEEIAGCVLALVGDHFPDHDHRKIFFTSQQLYNRLLKDGVVDKSFSPRQCGSWVRERAASGPLSFLSIKKNMHHRGWLYVGKDAAPDSPVLDIPESAVG